MDKRERIQYYFRKRSAFFSHISILNSGDLLYQKERDVSSFFFPDISAIFFFVFCFSSPSFLSETRTDSVERTAGVKTRFLNRTCANDFQTEFLSGDANFDTHPLSQTLSQREEEEEEQQLVAFHDLPQVLKKKYKISYSTG